MSVQVKGSGTIGGLDEGLVISGIVTSSTQINVGSNIKLGSAGVVTATSFSGSGANLTSLPAQATIANNADNRVITGGSGVNLNGEANLTFDGNILTATQGNSAIGAIIKNTAHDSELQILATYANKNSKLLFGDAADDDVGIIDYDHNTNNMIFTVNANERLRINSYGSVGINTISADDPNNPGLHIHGSASDNCRISFTTPTKSNPGSRIGYYGLSNRFGIDAYYGFEIRDVAASYATRFKIDNNGYMTTNQPYGHLRFNAKNDTGALVIQTDVNTADVQNGVSHNGSGRLTVPVAGKYILMLGCNILYYSQMQFRMTKNGSDIAGAYFQNSMSDTGWKSGSRTIVLPLSANDYIESKIQGKQDSQVWNHLTLYLLG